MEKKRLKITLEQAKQLQEGMAINTADTISQVINPQIQKPEEYALGVNDRQDSDELNKANDVLQNGGNVTFTDEFGNKTSFNKPIKESLTFKKSQVEENRLANMRKNGKVYSKKELDEELKK